MFFPIPPYWAHILRSDCALMPKCYLLSGQRYPAGPKRAPQITQAAPKTVFFLFRLCSANRLSDKLVRLDAKMIDLNRFGPQCNVQRAPRATCNAPFSTCNVRRISEGFGKVLKRFLLIFECIWQGLGKDLGGSERIWKGPRQSL